MVSPKTSELFKVTFIGEMVEIIVNSEASETGKMIVQGYLLDFDEDYYYLGENPLAVSTALKRDLVSLISIHDLIDPSLDMLRNMPDPEDEDEVM